MCAFLSNKIIQKLFKFFDKCDAAGISYLCQGFLSMPLLRFKCSQRHLSAYKQPVVRQKQHSLPFTGPLSFIASMAFRCAASALNSKDFFLFLAIKAAAAAAVAVTTVVSCNFLTDSTPLLKNYEVKFDQKRLQHFFRILYF